MTTVVQTTYPQQPGYPLQPGGYHTQQATYIQVPPPVSSTTATTTTTATTSTPGISPKYNKKAGLVTGILQIVAGAVLITFGVVLLAIGSWLSIGWNIWGSICFYIVTGILGVISKNQSRCVIIAYMVMCIISAICAGSQMIYDSSAAGISSHMTADYCGYYHDYYNYPHSGCGRQKAIIAMHSLSALVALGEMVIAIVGSAYCCSGVCGGGSTPSQTMVVTFPGQVGPSGQMTVIAPPTYPGSAAPPQGTYPQPPAYSHMQPGIPPQNVQQPGGQPLPHQPAIQPLPQQLAMQPLPQQPEPVASSTYEEPK